LYTLHIMSNTDRNNNLDTKSNHRKHKSLAALDTSNPNYKIFNISKKKSHSRLTSNGRNKKLNHKSFDIKPHNYSFEKTENLNEKSFNSIPSRIHSFDPCVSLSKFVLNFRVSFHSLIFILFVSKCIYYYQIIHLIYL